MADVGVIQRRNRTGFAGKALGELRIGHFDRDITIQPGIVGTIHFAHPAFTDWRQDFIRAEFVAYRKRHMQDSAKFTRSESGLRLDDGVLVHYLCKFGVWRRVEAPPKSK